jgi:hypothetical protein
MATNADTKISLLGTATTLTGNEYVPMTQNLNGTLTTVRATTQQIQQQLGISSLNPVFTGTATMPNATGTGTWANSGVTLLSGTATDTFSSPIAMTGPLVMSGTATDTVSAPLSLTGIVNVTGTATDTWAAPVSFTGAFTVAGRTTAVPAGVVGERIESVYTGVGMTSATLTNLTSISLTAGVWDVRADGDMATSAVTSLSAGAYGISTTSATLPASGRYQQFQYGSNAVAGYIAPNSAPGQRLVLTVTTTVYLVGKATFTSGTLAAEGTLYAIRAA